jgi:hypothetical protein
VKESEVTERERERKREFKREKIDTVKERRESEGDRQIK